MVAKKIARKVLRYYRSYRAEKAKMGPRVMKQFARHFPDATFVQIGSNDGKKHDPLHKNIISGKWSGVLVEPVPYIFKRLVSNYSGVPGLQFANLAVSNSEGKQEFYFVEKAAEGEILPPWYDELGSFNLSVILKHADRIPALEDRIGKLMVDCVTFEALCNRHGLEKPDLIHIDTEGFDFEILKTVDFSKCLPALMIYENKHLCEEDKRLCRQMLFERGYQLFDEAADTWCIQAGSASQEVMDFRASAVKILGARLIAND